MFPVNWLVKGMSNILIQLLYSFSWMMPTFFPLNKWQE